MDKKINCDVIRDLLPLYVDEVVSEETVALIERHLAKCEDCRKKCEEMKRPVFVPVEMDTKPIKNLKRKWTRMAFLIGIFAVVIAVVITSSFLGKREKQFTMKTIAELQEEAGNLEDNYGNLDLSKTEITIPDKEEIQELVFQVGYSLEDKKEKFEENIRKYVGLDASVDLTPYINVVYRDTGTYDWLVVPYSEATERELERIGYLSYNDGKNALLLECSYYMVEMSNYEVPALLTGDTKDYSEDVFGYFALGLGTPVAIYRLPEDDISNISYPLAEGEVYLQDAVAYVEKHLKEDYQLIGSEFLDYHVSRVDVRKLNDSVYYYQFELYTSYQGIPMNKKSNGVVRNTPLVDILGSSYTVLMFCGDKLGYVRTFSAPYEQMEVEGSYTEFISLQDACSLVSEALSEKVEYHVMSIDVMYQREQRFEDENGMEENGIESINCNPVYRFMIGNYGCYFDVNMVTGEVLAIGR